MLVPLFVFGTLDQRSHTQPYLSNEQVAHSFHRQIPAYPYGRIEGPHCVTAKFTMILPNGGLEIMSKTWLKRFFQSTVTNESSYIGILQTVTLLQVHPAVQLFKF